MGDNTFDTHTVQFHIVKHITSTIDSFLMINSEVIALGGSHKGYKRRKNDDRCLVTALDEDNMLIAVSDGLGGHPGGDVAAEDVIGCLKSIDIDVVDKSELLKAALNQADAIISRRVQKSPDWEDIGATATAAIIGGGWVYWAHLGNSRMYLMRNGILRQITRDHSFLQDLIDAGDISSEEAVNHPMGHVLDQCVGCVDTGADIGRFQVYPTDILLLCTDGLFRTVRDWQIAELLSSAENVSQSIDRLIEASLQSGNLDDVTVSIAFIR